MSFVQTRSFGKALITVISEGTMLWAPELRAPESEWRAAMPEADERGRIPLGINLVHIRCGTVSMVVDPGFPPPQPAELLVTGEGTYRTEGLDAGLQSLGVHPEDITHVAITHGHDDHFAGVTTGEGAQRRPRFPNAVCLVGKPEWERAQQEPESQLGLHLATVHCCGLLEPVEGSREVAPRITFQHAPGETPGHSIVRAASEGAVFYALGDLFHHPCEVEHPEWVSPFRDRAAMLESRRRLMQAAATESATLVFTHAPFPGWGRITAVGDGFRWETARFE